MAPSKSSLDRLPKLVSERWEADREAHEATLRDGLVGCATLSFCDAKGELLGALRMARAPETLVAQRLKLGGMCWRRGAQAILTARGWDQSERFDEAWALLAAHYQVEVHVLANVTPVRPPPPEKPRRSKGAG